MKLYQKALAFLLAAAAAASFPLGAYAAEETPPAATSSSTAATEAGKEAEEPAYSVQLKDGAATVTNQDGASVTFQNVLAVHEAKDGELLTLDVLLPSSYTSVGKSLLIFPDGTDLFNIADAKYALYACDAKTGKLGKATGEVITGKELEERGLRFGESKAEPGVGWKIEPDTQGTLNTAGVFAAAVSNTHVLASNTDAGPDYFLIRAVTSADDTLIAGITSVSDVTGGQWLKYSNGKWGFRLSADMEGALIGWKQINGKWYYFDSVAMGKNQMATGWKKLSGDQSGWYWFGESGAMVTGWQKIEGSWYFFNGGGRMQTGWLENGGSWYYLNGTGAMQTGWKEIGGKWYYFDSSGKMLTSRVIDGCQLDENGVWVQ